MEHFIIIQFFAQIWKIGIFIHNKGAKTFVINKLQKLSVIPNLDKKTNILFQDPESYLKMPYETNFRFVIGRKPAGPRFNSDHKLIPYTVVGSLLKKEQQKKLTKKQTLVSSVDSSSSSKSIRKSIRLSKAKFNPVVINILFLFRFLG